MNRDRGGSGAAGVSWWDAATVHTLSRCQRPAAVRAGGTSPVEGYQSSCHPDLPGEVRADAGPDSRSHKALRMTNQSTDRQASKTAIEGLRQIDLYLRWRLVPVPPPLPSMPLLASPGNSHHRRTTIIPSPAPESKTYRGMTELRRWPAAHVQSSTQSPQHEQHKP